MIVLRSTILFVIIGTIACRPPVKYDQRQEGEVNVRADLENFVILLIPTSSSGGSSALWDLLVKTVPQAKVRKQHPAKKHHQHQQEKVDIESEISSLSEIGEFSDTKHFIESKSAAPYHVDISRTRSNLAKLHPQIVGDAEKASEREEILIAHSPTVDLSKLSTAAEIGAAILKKAVLDEEQKETVINKDSVKDDAIVGGTRGAETSEEKKSEGELTLIGAESEQCGPGRKRDANGICQFVKN